MLSLVVPSGSSCWKVNSESKVFQVLVRQTLSTAGHVLGVSGRVFISGERSEWNESTSH